MFLHVTTRIEGKKNDDLLGKKGGGGFPYLCVMDNQGDVIAKPMGRDVPAFEQSLTDGRKYLDLKVKAATGDREATIEFTFLRTQMGNVGYDELVKTIEEIGKLTPEQTERYNALRGDAKYNDIMKKYAETARESPDAARATAMTSFVEMYKQNLVPSGRTAGRFWRMIAGEAQKNMDPEMFEVAYNALEKQFGDDTRYRGYLDQMRAKVVDLKKAAGKDALDAHDDDDEDDDEDEDDDSDD